MLAVADQPSGVPSGWMRTSAVPWLYGVLVAFFTAILLLVVVSDAARPASGRIIGLVLWIAFIAVVGLRSARVGVYVSETHLRLRGTFRTADVPWDEVRGFHTAPWRNDVGVFVDLADGTELRLPAILQGRRVSWPGGSTRDVLSVLERLRRDINHCDPVQQASGSR